MKLFYKLLGLLTFELLKHLGKKYRKVYPRMALFADDTLSQKLLVYGRYEKEYLECLEQYFLKIMDPDKICLDLGANLGNHALSFSPYFKHVHAFEPNKRTFKLLSYNVGLESNISAHNFGASNKNAIYKATERIGNQGASSIIQAGEQEIDYIEYDCRILDDYLPSEVINKIGFVKIDVEGHELQALQGIIRILERSSPLIAFELLKDGITSGKSPVIDFLKEQGYHEFFELYKINPVQVGVREIHTFHTKNYKMLIARK